ncbi:single-stranded DNA-binding protein [Amycolatopsis anabasis]|uniref:single-stranded DNA-binding protein n=1 Tax=Amycolatopsis anabasis TaxID=1840409 RepID=UPI00131B9BE2|nr:single-stranded DNA-binding protein [Amycolatopsis anabasis]
MAGDTFLPLIGNLAADPELRFTPTGKAVCGFGVISTPRTFDRQSGGWKDGTGMYMRCTAWDAMAEHIAESLRRGDRVVVYGKLGQRNWEDKEGNKRSSIELTVEEIGPSLRFATARITKATRTNTTNRPAAQEAPADPWEQSTTADNADGAQPATQQASAEPAASAKAPAKTAKASRAGASKSKAAAKEKDVVGAARS